MLMILFAGLLAAALQDATLVARDAIQPHLAIDAEGAAYVAFLKDGQIQLAVSSDQGKTFSAPVVAIDAKGKARGGMQRGPRVAVDGKKTVYVTAPLTFDEAEFKKPYPTADLYLAVSTDGGKTFSKPAMVNDVPKKAPESLHWLAASPGEGAFVAWLDLRQREKGGQDLFLAKIADQGRKISRNLPVAMTLCECCAPGLAIDGKGNPSLVFREGGTTSRKVFLAVSTNGGTSFGKALRLNQGESKIDS
jgi:hypothetical protein